MIILLTFIKEKQKLSRLLEQHCTQSVRGVVSLHINIKFGVYSITFMLILSSLLILIFFIFSRKLGIL